MIRMDVSGNLKDVTARFAAYTDDIQKRAVPAALNRTLTTVRASAAREIKKHFGALPIAKIKKRIRFKRATQAKPEGTLVFAGSRFRLFGNWPVTKTVGGGGARVRVRGIGGRPRAGAKFSNLPYAVETVDGRKVSVEDLRRAFIQRAAKTGVVNVFLRDGKERYPIQVLLAPGLGRAFTQQKIDALLAAQAGPLFVKNLQAELKYRSS